MPDSTRHKQQVRVTHKYIWWHETDDMFNMHSDVRLYTRKNWIPLFRSSVHL